MNGRLRTVFFFFEEEEEMKHKEKRICVGLMDPQCVDLPRAGDLILCHPSRPLFIPQSTFKPPFIPLSPVFLVPASVITSTSFLTCLLSWPVPFSRKTLISRDSVSSLLAWRAFIYLYLWRLKIWKEEMSGGKRTVTAGVNVTFLYR